MGPVKYPGFSFALGESFRNPTKTISISEQFGISKSGEKMKRLKDKNFNEKIKDKIYWSETDSCQEKAVSYYANAILSIDEARLLLVFHVMDRRNVSSSTLIRNLEKILIKQCLSMATGSRKE